MGKKRNLRILVAIIFCVTVLWVFRFPACYGNKATLERYKEIAGKIRSIGLQEEMGYRLLEKILAVGPRLTASPEAAAAVEVGRGLMEELEFQNVRLEPVTVGRWVRGEPEKAYIVKPSPEGPLPLSIAALGGSDGTPEAGITAPVIEVSSFEELRGLGERARGKIVFFNRPMDRTLLEPFAAYGGAADQRVRGAVEAAKAGAVAVLVRSLTHRVDGHPHTGLMLYDREVARIPAAAVSTADAETLSALLKKEASVSIHIRMDCRNLPPVPSANVVGEIVGSEFPSEVILLGGHLDSWDLSAGAHDDGAGCAISLEALRLLVRAGLRPRRTVRAVLFMDEEFGGTGGRFYARDEGRKKERHLAAMESDRGAFDPHLIAAGPRVLKKVKAWEGILKTLGILGVVTGGGGVDVAPLAEQGTALISIIPNSQRYFDVHHSALDVLDSVNPRELELHAVILATLAFLLAEEGV